MGGGYVNLSCPVMYPERFCNFTLAATINLVLSISVKHVHNGVKVRQGT